MPTILRKISVLVYQKNQTICKLRSNHVFFYSYLTTTVEELSQLSLEFKIHFESRKIMSLLAKRGNLSAFRRSEVIWLSKFKLDEIGLLLDFQNEKFFYCFNKNCHIYLPKGVFTVGKTIPFVMQSTPKVPFCTH